MNLAHFAVASLISASAWTPAVGSSFSDAGAQQGKVTHASALQTNQSWWLAKGLRVVTYEFLERNYRTNDFSPDEILTALDRLGGCDLVLIKAFQIGSGARIGLDTESVR